MRNLIYYLAFLVSIVSCNQSTNSIDIGFGSISYAQTVTIGTQFWMTKNLDVSAFRNGDPIPQAKSNKEWQEAGENKQPVWCYYYNDPGNGAKYGRLFNWYAVNDSRGLAPKGWHVPSDEEWSKLIAHLGGDAVAGGKMKSTTEWGEPNEDASNSSGFSGLPGGIRNYDGSFDHIGEFGEWWSSAECNTNNAYHIDMRYIYGFAPWCWDNKGNGYSVRCLRD